MNHAGIYLRCVLGGNCRLFELYTVFAAEASPSVQKNRPAYPAYPAYDEFVANSGKDCVRARIHATLEVDESCVVLLDDEVI